MDSSKTPFDDPGFAGKGEDKPGRASSATGAFGVVPTPQAREEDDLLKSLMRQPESSAPAGGYSGAPGAPGEFTQILNTLTHMPPATSAASAAPPVAKQGGDLAKVFRQVSIDKTPPPPPPPAATPVATSSAGSFTDTFSALSGKVTEEPVAPATPSHAAPVPTGTSPGSFTQMFSTLSGKPEEAAPAPGSAAAAPPVTPSGPGEFTKAFQAMQAGSRPDQQITAELPMPTLGPAAPPSAGPRTGSGSGTNPGPGSFTQMFSTLGGPSSHAQEPMRTAEPLPSFEPKATPASDFQFTSSSRPAEPPAQGGFTQLLQALNREPAPVKPEPPLAPLPTPNPQAAAPAVAAGGFTQLLRTLSAEPPAPAAPPPIAPPEQAVMPAPSSGPGEFTRVISGSALRELQGAGATAGVPAVAPAAAPPGYAPFQMPKAPQIPGAPAIQSIPQMPHAAAPPAAAPMPHFAPPAFQFPQAPAPAAAPPPVEPGKLQKYMPLILVLNVFVLLVIVLIVIFALHHK